MKEKILSALKNKFKSLGFGDKAFEGVAAYLAITITEEEKIEDGISNGVEELLKAFQGDIDKRVTDAVAKAKLEAVKKDAKPDPKPDPKKASPAGGDSEPDKDKTDDQTPAWVQALLDSNKSLSERIEAMEAGKTADSRKAQFSKKIDMLPESYKSKFLKDFSRMNFKDDEDFAAYLTETETDVEAIKKELTEKGLSIVGKPGSGSGGSSQKDVKEASSEEMDAIWGTISK